MLFMTTQKPGKIGDWTDFMHLELDLNSDTSHTINERVFLKI